MYAVKCDECGSSLRWQREDYPYDECGLPNITLAGVMVGRCEQCGYHEVEIPGIEELHRVLAEAVTKRPGRLRPDEIRFLRKHIGFDQQTLAEKMGVSVVTVSRWENDVRNIGPSADRLLRLLALEHPKVSDYAQLDAAREAAAPMEARLEVDSGGWRRGGVT